MALNTRSDVRLFAGLLVAAGLGTAIMGIAPTRSDLVASGINKIGQNQVVVQQPQQTTVKTRSSLDRSTSLPDHTDPENSAAATTTLPSETQANGDGETAVIEGKRGSSGA